MRLLWLILVLLPATAWAGSPTLRIDSGPAECDGVHGTYVAFVVPHVGSLLIATRPFPGGSSVGRISEGRLRFELAGLGTTAIETGGGAEGTEVWAMLDRSLDPGERSGCFAFGDRGFATVDDLKTYLHWFQRDLLFQLGEASPSLTLAGRRLVLEVTVEGFRPVDLEVVEGATVGLRLPGSEDLLLFLPVVISEQAPSAQIRVSRKRGEYFGPEALVPVGSVTAGAESTAVGGDPEVSIRIVSVNATDS